MLVTGAHAQSNTGMGVAYPAGSKLLGDRLYVVTYNCGLPPGTQHTYLGDDIVAGIKKLFGSSTTETFGFFLHTGGPLLKGPTAITDEVARSFAGADIAYSADTKTPANSFFNLRCGGQFIVKGGDNPSVVAFHSYAQATDTAKVQSAMTTLTSSANPLITLFAAVAPTAAPFAAGAIGNIATAVKSIAGLVSLSDNNQGGSVVLPLATGYAGLSTMTSSIGFNIVYVPDLLVAPGVSFRDSVARLIPVDTQTVATLFTPDEYASIRKKCDALTAAWNGLGLKSPIDQAYLLTQQIKATSSKKQLVECLGRAPALAALPHLALFNLPPEQQFDLQDIDDLTGDPAFNTEWGEQPQGWAKLGSTAALLIRDLNRLGRGDTLPSDEAVKFDALFLSSLKIKDDTNDFSAMHDLFPNSKDSFATGPTDNQLASLIGAGFTQWGCYVETDADISLKSDENEALVMTTWQKKSDKLTPMVVRVLFKNRDIAELVLTDQTSPSQVITRSGCTPPANVPSETK